MPTGVRKRTNSQYYYYRIKCKLPDGRTIAEEQGGFSTPESAYKSRCERFSNLLKQDIKIYDKTFLEVFEEFISKKCSDKPALQKKYQALFTARLCNLSDMKIESITIKDVEWIATHFETDLRNKEKKKATYTYINAVKALLWRVFDFAYVQGYVSNHILYLMPRMWGKEKTQKPIYVQPLFAYLGNKYRLLPDLIPLFPKDIEDLVFVDLFAGSATVATNTRSKKIIINEEDKFLLGIYKALSITPPDEAWEKVFSIVNKYELSAENEQGYYTCRAEYNKIPYEERVMQYWYWGLALVYHSFNRSTVQHNLKGEYNAPFGKEKCILEIVKKRFFPFAHKLYEGNFEFLNLSYKQVPIYENAFYYVDPPYLASTATYNKKWTEEDEIELYALLDIYHEQGIKWMLSNVLENNGVKNPILTEWMRKSKGKYKMFYLDRTYNTSNFRRKNSGKTVEIVVVNY